MNDIYKSIYFKLSFNFVITESIYAYETTMLTKFDANNSD